MILGRCSGIQSLLNAVLRLEAGMVISVSFFSRAMQLTSCKPTCTEPGGRSGKQRLLIRDGEGMVQAWIVYGLYGSWIHGCLNVNGLLK